MRQGDSAVVAELCVDCSSFFVHGGSHQFPAFNLFWEPETGDAGHGTRGGRDEGAFRYLETAGGGALGVVGCY